jgi:hypothetical protein
MQSKTINWPVWPWMFSLKNRFRAPARYGKIQMLSSPHTFLAGVNLITKGPWRFSLKTYAVIWLAYNYTISSITNADIDAVISVQ